jgi:hypothetical protein
LPKAKIEPGEFGSGSKRLARVTTDCVCRGQRPHDVGCCGIAA